MPRGLEFSVQLVGGQRAIDDLEGISERFEDAEPAFEQVIPILEAGEERHFATLRGRYVDTGALKASLTRSGAAGAIRDTSDDELVFGTSIPYARYLRGGRSNRRGTKKSAVLVLKPPERKKASETILDYVVEGRT